ncbi:uncharacterized protein LOC119085244 [Bradysia coprophila]|uniref:uncharacterized protein LOC119085244 n=1 Tax=Bradysia coprophila TaxID=38358 RepID=UPI00187D9BC7|nr:uncharacterized protein LOC119085244 [Bradysia coprophila]
MLIQVFIVIGFVCLSQGKECKDTSKPHQTRCDMYYKCVVLPTSKNIAWVPTNCKRGLVYDGNLKMCVMPDTNWECNLGDEDRPLKADDNNVYGINNLDYLNKEIQSYRPKYDENGEKILSDIDNYDSDTSDGEEKIVVVSSEDIDESNIEIIDDYNLSNETETNESDEVDYSGDGSDDNIVEKKETYIAIPVSSDPNKSVASHLQRLSQLIQSLRDSQTNKSQSYDLGPNELNNFLAHHNIKVEYNSQLEAQKKKQAVPLNEKKQPIPMDGRIHPDHLNEILQLQQKLQTLNAIQNGDYSTTTERPIEYGKYPVKSTIQIKSPNPVKNVRITDPGYSTSQIVVNRPEGSVLFSLPSNGQPPTQSQYQLQPSYNPNPSPPVQQQSEPYVSQDTLKTVLELSKQLISSSNHQQAIQNYIPEQNYLQPIFRPIYYNIPIHDLPVPIINNYEKKEPKHEDTKDAEPNYVKITSVSGFIDTTPKYQTENDGDKPSDEHSTIIHNHIPITIENPFQQSNKKSSKVSGPTVAPVTITTSSGISSQYDDYKPQTFADVYSSRPYRPYPEFNEGSYATYLTEPHLPNTNPTYSNAAQYPQLNQQNSGAYYLQQGQAYQQHPFYQDQQYPANSFPQSFYAQQTHLNDNNVNQFVNFNAPQYPTLRPASLPSTYQNQVQSVTQKTEPINTYQAFDENENDSDQQEPNDDELPTMMGSDDDNVEYDGNGNEEYETNEEDNIAADINKSNVMSLLADLQNKKIPTIQNKQLPERAPINPLLTGANDDSKRKVVHFGDNFMTIEEYEKLVQPLIDRNAFSGGDVDVIPCVTGARQPLAKDCTKYMVCNGATSKVLTYTCPPYTAFNQQTRFCDAKTFKVCKKDELSADSPSALDTITENKRLQLQLDKELEMAQKERDQALKTQQLTALIKQQTQNILNSRPTSVKRPMRNRRRKIKTTTAAPQPYYRTRPTKKRKNKPIIRRIPCKEPSKVADSLSIYNYFTCYKGKDGVLAARKMTCPSGLIFCERIRLCTSAARCGG